MPGTGIEGRKREEGLRGGRGVLQICWLPARARISRGQKDWFLHKPVRRHPTPSRPPASPRALSSPASHLTTRLMTKTSRLWKLALSSRGLHRTQLPVVQRVGLANNDQPVCPPCSTPPARHAHPRPPHRPPLSYPPPGEKAESLGYKERPC